MLMSMLAKTSRAWALSSMIKTRRHAGWVAEDFGGGLFKIGGKPESATLAQFTGYANFAPSTEPILGYRKAAPCCRVVEASPARRPGRGGPSAPR